MIHVVIDRAILLLNRVLLLRSRISNMKVTALLKFLMPVLESILRRITQLANGRPDAFPQFKVQIYRLSALVV